MEIAVFIEVGGYLGLWPTIGIVILTAAAGAAMLRQQGFNTLRRAQASANRGELPLAELLEGVCLLFAGALLLTPGFVTDVFGLALMLPPVRGGLGTRLFNAFKHSPGVSMRMDGGGPGFDRSRPGPVIDGDFEEIGPERMKDSSNRQTGPR